MRIEGARLEGRELILTLPAATSEARKLVYQFKAGNYELKRAAVRRTLDANAYCWTLCTKIAEAVGTTKEQVYRRAVTEVGSCIQMHVDEDDLPRFSKQWEGQGLGYQVQEVGRNPAYVIVNAYYGSHLYDTHEMSVLIDNLIQDAKALDIETMPEEELQSLLNSWR